MNFPDIQVVCSLCTERQLLLRLGCLHCIVELDLNELHDIQKILGLQR
mgnify:CR=1 FL=1